MPEENTNNKRFSAADIERYHNGQMTVQEMHLMEKAALEDPFLADAIEGYTHAEPASISGNIKSLEKRLNERINSGKIKALPVRKSNDLKWLKVAAMFILIIGLGWAVYQFTFNRVQNDVTAIANKNPPTDLRTQDTNQNSSVTVNDNILKEADKRRTTKIKTENANVTFFYDKLSSRAPERDSLQKDLALSETQPPVSLPASNGRKENFSERITKADTIGAQQVTGYGTLRIRGNSEVSKDSLPLIVVNGAVTSKEEFAKINPSSIQNTEILKDAQASAIYGSRAANGVVVITLKDQKSDIAKADVKKTTGQNDDGVINDFYKRNNAPAQAKVAPAQQNVFRGQVVDPDNNPLPFANVTSTRDNIGTYTDAKGNFTLISPDSILNVQVKSIGFGSSNTQLRNDLSKNQVMLQEDRAGLNEVVIGSGKKKQANLSRESKMVLEEPEPADGWTNYHTYVANNLNPPDDIKEKTPGKVEVSFEVNDKGEPVNIKIEKSLCKKCDEEAIRIIKEGPKWKKKGKRNRAKMTIPFE